MSTPSLCTTDCGDGIIAGSEICDDGSTDGLGCLADCSGVNSSYVCTNRT